MKNIRIILQIFSLLLMVMFGCKKDENKDFYESGAAPVLTASKTDLNLVKADSSRNAVIISWTNPDYKFTTGVSSQTVTYLLEIDTAGGNFSSSKLQAYQYSGDLELKYTVKQFNALLLKMELPENISQNLEFRVTSYLTPLKEPKLVSNVITIKATPYSDALPPKVPVPTDGTLWLTGTASTSGYANPLPSPYDVSQQFTKISETVYELSSVALKGGGDYKLIQTQGVWGSQYHMVTGTWEGGDFEKKDAAPGFPGPPAAGNYKISVDFQKGKFAVVKL